MLGAVRPQTPAAHIYARGLSCQVHPCTGCRAVGRVIGCLLAFYETEGCLEDIFLLP